MKKLFLVSVLANFVILLSACGGGSGSSVGRGGVMEGELTLKVTDAPIDGATQVIVAFTGVTLKPADNPAIDVMFDQPQQIDLLSLQAGRTEFLLENIRVPAGKYNWIRLHVNAIRDFDFDSYIELNDGQQHELDIPSGDERGLQIIHDIEVEANGSVNFVIDFDLRKSIVEAGGNYSLKPVLRIADLNNTGSLTGIADTTISSTVLNAAANCLDGGMAVYVFEGADTVTDDIDGDSGDPVASANVVLNGSGEYEYVVSFLEPGLYTVGLTCDADLDQADTDDVITFVAIENVNIVSQRETIKVLR